MKADVALFFTSKSCPACLRMYPVIQGLILRGYNIKIVQVETNQNLLEVYKIQALPTIVFKTKDGNETNRLIGVVPARLITRELDKNA
ncbi:MAG: thioredoxin family protein [Clostridia bacterium]|jgi:thiol-disulfide isomerase/thioredoxin